jgi:hypothetical protein
MTRSLVNFLAWAVSGRAAGFRRARLVVPEKRMPIKTWSAPRSLHRFDQLDILPEHFIDELGDFHAL